ncbi:hypothetical protein SKAU_G00394140 [Synaphobranchus kaupii]|uniref:Uncharacterized protein n=1 Tax=Synaphobranchus kaupii TaxID=118154 RepID=A0A9Q1EC47_SYNKA|nr:hypothetical protein SKAU_G00394140 [Synaphobranchus kaupii]
MPLEDEGGDLRRGCAKVEPTAFFGRGLSVAWRQGHRGDKRRGKPQSVCAFSGPGFFNRPQAELVGGGAKWRAPRRAIHQRLRHPPPETVFGRGRRSGDGQARLCLTHGHPSESPPPPPNRSDRGPGAGSFFSGGPAGGPSVPLAPGAPGGGPRAASPRTHVSELPAGLLEGGPAHRLGGKRLALVACQEQAGRKLLLTCAGAQGKSRRDLGAGEAETAGGKGSSLDSESRLYSAPRSARLPHS